MNKIISMNHSTFGAVESIEYTEIEQLAAEIKVAQSMQEQGRWSQQVEELGWVKEGELFVALVDLANSDPAHVLNAKQEVDWNDSDTTPKYTPDMALHGNAFNARRLEDENKARKELHDTYNKKYQ